eukprot:6487855-Amphidinium_carterae.2
MSPPVAKVARSSSKSDISKAKRCLFGVQDQMDDGTMSKAGSAVSASIGDSSADPVERWANALPIHDVLKGKKVGVSYHHATNALGNGSLDSMQQVQLRAHLRLYDMALKLAPQNLAKQSADDVHIALQELADVVTEWPAALQEHMWEQVEEQYATAVLAEGSQNSVNSFLECIRPYELAQDGPFCIHRPHLAKLCVPESQKIEMFTKVLVLTLNKLVQRGVAGQEQLRSFCSYAMAGLETHLEESLPDECVEILSELFSLFQGICSLLEVDIFKMYEAKAVVSELMSKMKSKRNDAASLVANSLASVTYYGDLIRNYTQQLSLVDVHKQRLDNVQLVLSEDQRDLGFHRATNTYTHPNDVWTLFQKCFNYFANLPESATSGLSEKAEQKVMAFTARLSDIVKIESCVGQVEDLLMEAAKAWPNNTVFLEVKHQLLRSVAEMAGQNKVSAFSEKLSKYVDQKSDPQQHVEELLELGAAARGVDASKSHKDIFERGMAWLEEALTKAVCNYEQLDCKCMDLYQSLLSWVNTDVYKHTLQRMRAGAALVLAYNAFKGQHEKVQDMLAEDTDSTKVAALLRACEAARLANMEKCSNWCNEGMKVLLTTRNNIRSLASQACKQTHVAALQAAIEKCADIGGGVAGGGDWHESLSMSAEWSAVSKVAQSTLMKASGEAIKSGMNGVAEALAAYEKCCEFYSLVAQKDHLVSANDAIKRARTTYLSALMFGVLLAEPVEKVKARKVCHQALKECDKYELVLPAALKDKACKAQKLQ